MTYLTISQVSKRYKVSTRCVASWIKAGLLAAVNVAPEPCRRPAYRISEEAIRRFEDMRRGDEPRGSRCRTELPDVPTYV